MRYRLHIAVTDGAKRYRCIEDRDEVPVRGERIRINCNGLSGEAFVYSEFGRLVEGGVTGVYLYAHPTRQGE